MYSKRKGTTLLLKMSVLTDGESVSLIGRNITILLIDPRGNTTLIEDFSVSGEFENIVSFVYEGRLQRYTGVYRVEVYENYMSENMASLDTDVFELVPRSAQENKEGGLASAVIDLSLDRS